MPATACSVPVIGLSQACPCEHMKNDNRLAGWLIDWLGGWFPLPFLPDAYSVVLVGNIASAHVAVAVLAVALWLSSTLRSFLFYFTCQYNIFFANNFGATSIPSQTHSHCIQFLCALLLFVQSSRLSSTRASMWKNLALLAVLHGGVAVSATHCDHLMCNADGSAFTFEWIVDETYQTLNATISAPSDGDSTWLAIGLSQGMFVRSPLAADCATVQRTQKEKLHVLLLLLVLENVLEYPKKKKKKKKTRNVCKLCCMFGYCNIIRTWVACSHDRLIAGTDDPMAGGSSTGSFSDMIIGSYDSGGGGFVVRDYHTTTKTVPTLDASQDVVLDATQCRCVAVRLDSRRRRCCLRPVV